MIFAGFGPPNSRYLQDIEQYHISYLHVLKNLQDIYKEGTVNCFQKIYMFLHGPSSYSG